MKESVERLVDWGAYYFTSREIWYPLPEKKMKLGELKSPKLKKILIDVIPGRKKKCKSGHHQIVLLSDEEVEGRRLQWQGAELCQKIYITNSSNQSVMQTKNTVTNINVTVKFCSMVVTKLVLRTRKVITRNRWIWEECLKHQIVGNKAKGRISERVFQENKARQIFQKTNVFLPPDTHTYVLLFLTVVV